jgi:hypothetical protein
MYEPTTNAATRRAFDRARTERAEAFKMAWGWLFSTKSSR